MKALPLNPDTLKEVVDVLKKGGVIAHPADTCFGLAGDLMNPKAVKKIQDIKKRHENEPMSIMISVPEQIRMKEYVELNEVSDLTTRELFPSPVTLVLPKGPKIPKWFFPEHKKVGLRVPMHDLTQDLLRAFGGPLITTSANISGQPILFECNEVIEHFKDHDPKPDLVIEGKSSRHNQASTVITLDEEVIRIIRKGPITASQLESILGMPVKQ